MSRGEGGRGRAWRRRRGRFCSAGLLLIGLSGGFSGCRTSAEGLAISDAAPSAERPALGADLRAPSPPTQVDARPVVPPAVDGAVGPGPAAACTAGQVHCAGRVPQICAADGTWLSAPPCAYACQGGCVNRFAAVSSGRGSPTNEEGLAEFARNTETFFSERGGLFGARGFNVAVMDPGTGAAVEPVKNFDPWTTPLSGNALSAMADYLEAIEPGRLVLIATCDDAGITRLDSCDKWDTAPVQRLLTTLRRLGSEQIDAYCYRGAWSLVAISGQTRALAEKLSPGAKVTAEVVLPAMP
jgi:hypothetical protein